MEEIKKPSIWQRIKNFITALWEHITSGFQHVSKDTLENRLSICKGCDQFNDKNQTCNVCGCFIPLKTKWKDQQCPKYKW